MVLSGERACERDEKEGEGAMPEMTEQKHKRGNLPPRNPKGRKWSVMAGLTPPDPPKNAPGFDGASDISDTGDYFINSDYN